MSLWRVTVASALLILTGCPGPGMVGLRPDGTPEAEPCPKKALETMALLDLHPGVHSWLDVDVNQTGVRSIVINDGPISSRLQEELGPFGAGTLLYGRAWTRGDYVVIRYYEARRLDLGPTVPICAVASLSGGQLRKKPGPAPGSATLDYSVAAVHIVDSFR
jgi:hypothetical protein